MRCIFKRIAASLAVAVLLVPALAAQQSTAGRNVTRLNNEILAAATQALSEDDLLDSRMRLQKQLAPYRSKMSTEQLALLEKQYVHRESFRQAGIPRLSLFFLS